MVSREVRENVLRVGFRIEDLASGKQGWLAHVEQKVGPAVGKYRVNLFDLEAVGAEAISEAVDNADVVAIDEIGPMELFSERFRAAARNALWSSKPVLAVVHFKAQDKLVLEAKAMAEAEVAVVTVENRDKLPEQLTLRISGFLECCL
jgi:nucleoside-triphosphatase